MHTKRKMALRMMTATEIKRGISPFDSLAWRKRKNARAKKLQEQMLAAQERHEKKRKERAKAHKALLKQHKEVAV